VTTDLREHLQATLGDAYTLERELGGGGMSRVFLAEETSLGRRVVVKVLAPEQLERVFEPFVQADQRLTRTHAGVGLGLAISRDLARGMGGDLRVRSVEGEGATFTVTLRRVVAADAPDDAPG
jgi:hypothetical protein